MRSRPRRTLRRRKMVLINRFEFKVAYIVSLLICLYNGLTSTTYYLNYGWGHWLSLIEIMLYITMTTSVSRRLNILCIILNIVVLFAKLYVKIICEDYMWRLYVKLYVKIICEVICEGYMWSYMWRLYVKVGILLTCGKYLHDLIMLVEGRFGCT